MRFLRTFWLLSTLDVSLAACQSMTPPPVVIPPPEKMIETLIVNKEVAVRCPALDKLDPVPMELATKEVIKAASDIAAKEGPIVAELIQRRAWDSNAADAVQTCKMLPSGTSPPSQ